MWCPLSKHSRKRFWNFCITCCSMVGEIAATSSLMLCFKSTVVLGFFSYTLLLSYLQSKKSQTLRSGDLAGPSIFPLRESRRAGNISLRTRIAVLAVWTDAPSCWNQNVWFQHQVSATPGPEMCKVSQCSRLNLLLLTCLPRLQSNRGRSPQKMLHYTKQ
jgi:hypothetical protein